MHNAMTSAYLEAMFFTHTSETDAERDADLSPGSLAQAAKDCAAFREQAGTDADGLSDESLGHDFWLTRNHHGVGFWDRGYGERGDRLTALAHKFGECDLYLGDDGDLHLSETLEAK